MASNSPARTAETAAAKASGFSLAGVVQYLKEVREELKKAVWPTREELIRMTQVVLFLIAVTALYCGGLDAILGLVTTRLFQR